MQLRIILQTALSVQYLNSRYNNGGKAPFTSTGFACNGGTPGKFASFYNLAGKYGGNQTSIPWSNANASWMDGNASLLGHTRIDSASINMTPAYQMNKMSAFRVETLGLEQEDAIYNIKTLIDGGTPVILSFYLPDSESWKGFYDFWDIGREEESFFSIDAYADRPYTSGGGVHTVLVTGYTDDGTTGYWQCLNSWGAPANRPNGLFYVNMYMDYSAYYPDMEFIPVTTWEILDVTYVPPSEDPNGTPISMTADFSVEPSSGYPPLSVHFTDLSEGNPTQWKWDFGDGGGSIMSNPNHTYAKPGKYSVSLLVSNGGYSAESEQKDIVTVKIPYISVTAFPKPDGGNYSVPTDPNNDGRFEDINGNGWLEYEDPVIFMKNMDFAMKKEPVLQFDFDGSGFIGYGDIVALQKMV
jgi:PKD repeat protein